MKKLLVFLLLLIVAVGALGYWRGWFSVSNHGVQTDAEKFKQDKEAFSKSVGEKTKSMKDQVASLWKKTEGLSGDDKAHVEKELAELEKKHERLEKQLKELADAGPVREHQTGHFEGSSGSGSEDCGTDEKAGEAERQVARLAAAPASNWLLLQKRDRGDPMAQPLRVVIIKPSKYTADGYVERFRWGFMPNSTVPYLRSMTPTEVNGTPTDVQSVDEYVHTDLRYLSLLKRPQRGGTLVAMVGVQSHQFHRALDLAAYASRNGCMAVIGGPHVMTCDTTPLQGHGVSFAQAEAELVWPEILKDAADGDLKPVYGREQRWQQELEAPEIVPPSRKDLGRYVIPMLGLYPARGCPFLCNFCSVTKIAGRRIRSQSIATTMASLRAAKAAGVRLIMFTSDNFNKYPEAAELLTAMVDERLGLEFFVQCDTQIARQERLVALLAKAGCFQMFVGVESFNRQTLLAAKKGQNRPDTYRDIVRLCRAHAISSHFSNIIGFPQDTEREVHEHLEVLRALSPTWVSFYVLCPIPGTEQYDDFMAAGLVTEKNLDRFDTTCLTWRHPFFSPEQLSELLFACYRKFFSLRHALRNLRDLSPRYGNGILGEMMGSVAMSLFSRHCAWRRTHPMSGGVARCGWTA